MKKNPFARITVVVFLILIFLSIVLSRLTDFFGVKLDVELRGYTDEVSPVDLTAQSFADGTYQEAYTASLDEKLPLYGRMVRTYNTINYRLFRKGNRIIGGHGSVFETPYIEVTLATGNYDYSDPVRAQELQDMTDQMVSVNRKLQAVGKTLYVYVCPGKSTVYPEDIPAKDREMAVANQGAVSPIALFRVQLEQAGTVPYKFCIDDVDTLEYPAFYPTGIHWSRTYEQTMSQKIIADLSTLTGNHYRNFHMTGVTSGKEPYWRDSDVYDLLNVWGRPDVTYYQYVTAPDDAAVVNGPDAGAHANPAQKFIPMRLLIFGDSYSEGLRYDVTQNLPEDELINVSRNNQVTMADGTTYPLEQDWKNLNWQYCLDNADAVVIEFVEPEIINYTYGFLTYLDQFLDTYEPGNGTAGGNG